MNDFERKLRQQAFRQPPAELRAALCEDAENGIVPPSWTWRDWFWPSPAAWGALAALWVAFAAVSFSDSPTASSASNLAQQPLTTTTLLSYHTPRDFHHVLDLPN